MPGWWPSNCWPRCRERPGSEKPFHTAENLARIAGFDIALDFEAAHTPRTVDPRALGVELDKLLPRERNIVYDAGNFLGILPYITVPTPGHLKMTSEFASIGLGFGTALGVAKGRPNVPTVLVIGDGGFLMTMSELETVVREDIPLIIVLMNDCAYGAELHFLALRKLPVAKVSVPGRGLRDGGGGVRVSGVHHPHPGRIARARARAGQAGRPHSSGLQGQRRYRRALHGRVRRIRSSTPVHVG